MVEWPVDRWLEWFDSNRGFRRSRSYGALYKIGPVDTVGALEGVTWIGSLKHSPGLGYFVDLTLGHNFSIREPERPPTDAFDYEHPPPQAPP